MKNNQKPKQKQKPFIIAALLITAIAICYGVFLYWGGPNHLQFIAKPGPNQNSEALKQARQDVAAKQADALSILESAANLEPIDAGYIDMCVHGYEGALGKGGSSYIYKCAYKTNQLYGARGAFADHMAHAEAELLRDDWTAASDTISEIVAQYPRLRNQFKNAINALPAARYYKDTHDLEIVYADLSPSNADPTHPTEQVIDEAAQAINGEINGETVYEDTRFIDYTQAIKKAQEKGYGYIFMISGEEEYFRS